MNFAHAEKIAAAVLYEGYILYPYRASSTKNVQRWNFGTLYPRDYAEAQRPAESYSLHAECLLEADGNATLDVRVRFLHLARKHADASRQWDVGEERTVEQSQLRLSDLLAAPLSHAFHFDAQTTGDEPTPPRPIAGHCDLSIETISPGVHKLLLTLTNTTPMPHPADCSPGHAMLEAFVSAHVLLGINGGAFISLLEPPDTLSEATAGCRNAGVFPVLVGEAGERTTMLCSPIILYDYPQIAPESLGDFFDGTEMDEMLALRVMTLTDEEKQEMRTTDPRASRILERTDAMPQDQLMKVHGAIRGMRHVHDAATHKETP